MSSQAIKFNTWRSFDAPDKQVRPTPNRLFQTSTMAAFLNAVDGEMIVDSGGVHQFRADGRASAVPGDLHTPFACVTHFKPEFTVALDHPREKAELETLVDGLVGNPNLFVALRFGGWFEAVETRTVFCQCRPYP